MKISAVNVQNNNYSNKSYKPSFGMHFSEYAITGIEGNQHHITQEMAIALAKLKDNNDSCVLSRFTVGGFVGDCGSEFRKHCDCIIDVKDQHGISVFNLNKRILPKKLHEKVLETLKYLSSAKFQEKVARLDKPNQAKAAAIEAEKQAKEVEELEKQKLLGYVTETAEVQLVEKTLSDFVQSGIPENKARPLIIKLIQSGVRTEDELREIAQLTNFTSSNEKLTKNTHVLAGNN